MYTIFSNKTLFLNFPAVFLAELRDFKARPVLLKNVINNWHNRNQKIKKVF